MTVDLWCVTANALWGLLLVVLEVAGKKQVARDQAAALPPWLDRAGRALGNHKENFPLFLSAVLVVHLAGRADRTSAIAAVVYVVARVVHSLVYIRDLTPLRTLSYAIGVVACLVIMSRLVV